MTSITFSDILTIIFMLVDDRYKIHGIRYLKRKPGAKPEFSDSEVITLMLAIDFIPFPGETQFLGYIRANYFDLFPKLIDQSQFNRRARSLRLLVEELRRYWLFQMGTLGETNFLLDTKPVPVVGYKRHKKHSDFLGSAGYGRCESRKPKYFGYKLVAVTTFSGLPVVYDMFPAHTDERQAADTILYFLFGSYVFADKGFIGADWQADIYDCSGTRIYTTKRVNQAEQNTQAFDRWLNSIRERIEGAFHEIQNTGHNIENYLPRLSSGCALGSQTDGRRSPPVRAYR